MLQKHSSRAYGVGVAFVFTLATAAAIAAPPANAWVSGIKVSSERLTVGYSYKVTAIISRDLISLVSFTDNGDQINGSPVRPWGFEASVTWTPKTPGTHELTAWQRIGGIDSKTITVVVADKNPVDPSGERPGTTGSANSIPLDGLPATGSANLP
ncbi:hypothetical protein ACFYO1_26515 [Nocardia sp. NPDC006044]|uniref:hypothetical protein n=1 Tax=Nocardia sp. NPDC006044 TaxID=3364306 RepID=UPI0036B0E190